MLSKTTVLKVLSIAFLILPSALLAYVDGLILSPGNLPTIEDKLAYLHGDIIEIPFERVTSFLEENTDGGYNSQLGVPNPKLIEAYSSAIKFEWSPIPHAVEYIVRYQNLKNGLEETFYTSNPYIVMYIPDDLYLLTFQIKDDTGRKGKSRLYVESKGTKFIIIEDKPLFNIINENNDCGCNIPLATYNVNVLPNETTIYNYPTGVIDEIFHVNVDFESSDGSNLQSNYYLRIMRNLDNLMAIGIYHATQGVITGNSLCTEDMDLFALEFSHVYAVDENFSQNEDEFRAVRFRFDDGLKAKNIGPGASTSITMTQCEHSFTTPPFRLAQSSSDSAPIKIYPNPSDGFLTIDFVEVENIPQRFQILNNYGQVMKEFSATNIEEYANIEELPSGLYHIKLISEKNTASTAFVKI